MSENMDGQPRHGRRRVRFVMIGALLLIVCLIVVTTVYAMVENSILRARGFRHVPSELPEQVKAIERSFIIEPTVSGGFGRSSSDGSTPKGLDTLRLWTETGLYRGRLANASGAPDIREAFRIALDEACTRMKEIGLGTDGDGFLCHTFGNAVDAPASDIVWQDAVGDEGPGVTRLLGEDRYVQVFVRFVYEKNPLFRVQWHFILDTATGNLALTAPGLYVDPLQGSVRRMRLGTLVLEPGALPE